jgi:pre-mRNA-splicing factor 18
MVGIHERSGRERISTAKVAHVMNNELQRKYLTSVKRLMTYAQTKRPDVAPSMKVF